MPSSTRTARYLLADVGGTNTRLAIATGNQIDKASLRKFKNHDHAELADILEQFLTELDQPQITAATVAIAGAVSDGATYLTNRGWHFDVEMLANVTGTGNVALINDLAAQGYALNLLDNECFSPIMSKSKNVPGMPRLVVGIGTGFNCAPVWKSNDGYLVPPAESGHAAFPSIHGACDGLAEWLSHRLGGFVSIEDVLSGRGLENCHSFASRSDRQLSAAQIVQAARDGDEIAITAMNIFVSACGAVLGDLALHFLPRGGITLVGGVANSTAPFLKSPTFRTAFCNKGRLSEMMKDYSVDIVKDDNSALIGCLAYCRQMFG